MREKPRLEWRAQARADLMEIVGVIAGDNPQAAQAMKDEIEGKVSRLTAQPKLYRVSPRAKGLREMVVRSGYIVLYREASTLIEIVNVVHARRHWPPVTSG